MKKENHVSTHRQELLSKFSNVSFCDILKAKQTVNICRMQPAQILQKKAVVERETSQEEQRANRVA